jgi:hypothetical protein
MVSDLTERLRNRSFRLATRDFNGDGAKLAKEAADEIDRLRNVIRQFSCPRPCNGRPDDFTAGECLDAGECGCMASALGKEVAK